MLLLPMLLLLLLLYGCYGVITVIVAATQPLLKHHATQCNTQY